MTPAQIRSITLSAKKRYRGDHEDVRQAALLRCLEWEQRNGKALPAQFNPILHVHASAAKLGLWGRKLGREVLDEAAPSDHPDTSSPSPEDIAILKEAVSGLSPVTVAYISGASSADLALEYGVHKSTITSRVSRDIGRFA